MTQRRPEIVLVTRSLIHNERSEFLLLQRAETDSYGSGLWELPGGKMDSGQNTRDSRNREILEESGLEVEQTSSLVCEDSFVLTDGKYAGLTYVVLTGLGKVVGGSLRLSEEHDAAVWVKDEAALRDYELTGEARKAITSLSRLMLDQTILS